MGIAETLKELRQLHEITQRELAEKVGLSVSSIVSYENGLREPNSKAMAALESFFNVNGDFLRGDFEFNKYMDEANRNIENYKNISPVIRKFNNISTYIPTVKNDTITNILDDTYNYVDKNILAVPANSIDQEVSIDFRKLLDIISRLNAEGRKEFIKRGLEMVNLFEYTDSVAPPHTTKENIIEKNKNKSLKTYDLNMVFRLLCIFRFFP